MLKDFIEVSHFLIKQETSTSSSHKKKKDCYDIRIKEKY